MAVNRWLGHAPEVARVVTLTVGGTVADGDTVTYTMNGKAVTVTATTGDDEADVAAALYAALNACTIPEFREVRWSYTAADDFVTGTATAPGVPFAGTASDTGTTTLTEAEVAASDGPNHVDSVGNWSEGSLPDATEDVLIDGGPDGLWGFENLSAAAYASFRVTAGFTGNWGLPRRNPNGYVEYRGRAHPLATAIPAAVGEGDGTGPARVNLTVTTAVNLTVYKTGVRSSFGLTGTEVPAVNAAGFGSGTVTVVAGDVGLAADDDTLAATATTAVVNEGGTLTVGRGATATTLNQNGGTVVGLGAVTTLNITAGRATLHQAPTTVTADGGTVAGRFTGTLATATFRGQGDRANNPALDFSADPRARTITNGSFTGGAAFTDPDKTTTWSNAFTFDAASLAASDLGRRFTLARG